MGSVAVQEMLEKTRRTKWEDANDLGVFGKLLAETQIKIVDVGARGGSVPQLQILAPFSTYVACEPDPRAANELEAILKAEAPWRNILVVRNAIASKEGDALLYVTRQPGLSSLLMPDAEAAQRYGLAKEFKVVRKQKVKTIPLRTAAATFGFKDVCFVKVDTQGTELQILESGRKLLTRQVLGVLVEAEFQPFYKGQAVFADIDVYMRELGFRLITLDRTSKRLGLRHPLAYSRRETVWAHCLYFKDLEWMRSIPDDQRSALVVRQIGLALAFEQFDFAGALIDSDVGRAALGEWRRRIHLRSLASLVRRRLADRLVGNFAEQWGPSAKDRRIGHVF